MEGPAKGAWVRSDYPHAKKKVFDSQKEYKRWLTLLQAQAAGAISNLQAHPPAVKLHAVGGQVVARYYPDFTYVECGKLVIEDCKGQWARGQSQVYKLKKRWIKAEYGIDIREV